MRVYSNMQTILLKHCKYKTATNGVKICLSNSHTRQLTQYEWVSLSSISQVFLLAVWKAMSLPITVYGCCGGAGYNAKIIPCYVYIQNRKSKLSVWKPLLKNYHAIRMALYWSAHRGGQGIIPGQDMSVSGHL